MTLIHLGAALTPGPDIFLTVRNSLTRGRTASLATTVGIVIGVAIQISLCLLGLIGALPQQAGLFRLLAALPQPAPNHGTLLLCPPARGWPAPAPRRRATGPL